MQHSEWVRNSAEFHPRMQRVRGGEEEEEKEEEEEEEMYRKACGYTALRHTDLNFSIYRLADCACYLGHAMQAILTPSPQGEVAGGACE